MAQDKKKISAVVACYAEEQSIPVMHERLTRVFCNLNINYEIIFVNDASPDHSEEILRALVNKDPHVIAINHARSFNSQMAFSNGMNLASGDAVVLLDGDLQDPPEMIADLYAKWTEGYDVVYGIRVKREAPWYMRLSYNLFYKIFRNLSDVPMPLYAGDFSLIDRRVVDILNSFPERDRFLRGLRAWVGFKQIGIPYTRPERIFGKTQNNLRKNFYWATKGIFSFSLAPLRFMTSLSLLMFCVSIVAIILQIIAKFFFSPNIPHGITTIIVISLFLGSIQLLGLSILGEYIGKIFEEVKQRPPYIVKSIFRNPHNSTGNAKRYSTEK